ncbi:MAG: pre-peptidase C-terminal domain-containing protein [Elainellaceae cyanobacterium]
MPRRDSAKNNLNRAKRVALRPQKQAFKDFVGQNDRDDLYRFRASSSSSVRLKLKGLQDNADLQVFAPKRSLRQIKRRIGSIDFSELKNSQVRRFLSPVAGSRRGGKRNEAIAVDVEPGTYYIRVSPKGSASTSYRLITRISEIPAPTLPPTPINQTPFNPTPADPVPSNPVATPTSPPSGPTAPALPPSTEVNDDILVTSLYSGIGLPTQQGALALGQVPVPFSDIPANLQPLLPLLPAEAAELVTPAPFATQTAIAGGVVLDTRSGADPNAGYAGYSNYTVDASGVSLFNPTNINFTPVDPGFPTLDNTTGYSLNFDLAINAESSVANRSGFSLLVVGNDGRAIELDFKANRIFAQAAAFGVAETVTPGFSLAKRNSYALNVSNGGYELFANGSSILSGSLRTYSFDPAASDPPLPVNPYATPNFVFMGDLTDGGSVRATLGSVSLFT